MKRILAIAAALTLTVAVGSASAHHGGHHGWHHGWHHHHHGFAIVGSDASFSGTQNSDGTYTGDLTLTLTKHSHFARMSHRRMARMSHHFSGDTGTDQTETKTFHLDGTEVKFSDSVTDSNGDNTVDFSDVQPTDMVVLKVDRGYKFRGHKSRYAKAHSSCHNGSGDTSSDSTTTPTITKAYVFRPDTQDAQPDQKD